MYCTHLYIIYIFTYILSQPELTVENLPSFLSLGKALLLLFVGEEADDDRRRQNEMLVEEMKGAVELGQTKMEKYLPSWIHLYVHQSQMIFNQYRTGFFSQSINHGHTNRCYFSLFIFLISIVFCLPVVALQLLCLSLGHTLALCPDSPLWSSPICPLVMKSISTPQTCP